MDLRTLQTGSTPFLSRWRSFQSCKKCSWFEGGREDKDQVKRGKAWRAVCKVGDKGSSRLWRVSSKLCGNSLSLPCVNVSWKHPVVKSLTVALSCFTSSASSPVALSWSSCPVLNVHSMERKRSPTWGITFWITTMCRSSSGVVVLIRA